MVLYTLSLAFGLLVVGVDFAQGFYTRNILDNVINLKLILTLTIFIFYQLQVFILIQKRVLNSREKITKKLLQLLIISLFLLGIDLQIAWLQGGGDTGYLRLIWNTLKIDFYFLITLIYCLRE